jgi:uncharacterized XkdX family phage protein
MTFETIKAYYESGLWSIIRVQKALELGKITQEEYEQISNRN